jgi:hypothetical protein
MANPNERGERMTLDEVQLLRRRIKDLEVTMKALIIFAQEPTQDSWTVPEMGETIYRDRVIALALDLVMNEVK